MKNLLYIIASIVTIGCLVAVLYTSKTKPLHIINADGDSLTAAGEYQKYIENSVVRNYGVPGVTTDTIKDFPVNAEYVIVWGGVNDLYHDFPVDQTISNLQSLYDRIHQSNNKVIAITITPYKGYFAWTPDKQLKLHKINEFILNSDADIKVNPYPVLNDPNNDGALLSQYSVDKLHLTAEGYKVVGDMVNKFIY